MNNKQVITLPNSNINSLYNDSEKLSSHVNSLKRLYDGATVKSDKMESLERVWTLEYGIANMKVLKEHDTKNNVKTWVYSFKNDDILTIHEVY